MCVCKSESKFDITTVPQKGRRDYVTLLRAYNKANPGKSVQVAIKVVREAMGADPPASKSGGVAFMASISSLLGDEVSELDAWLSANKCGDDSGFFVMGGTSGAGALQFLIEEDIGAPQSELASTRFVGALRDAGGARAIERLRIVNTELNARNNELEMQRVVTSQATPFDNGRNFKATHPNPALDAPSAMNMAMTPKQLYLMAITPKPGTPCTCTCIVVYRVRTRNEHVLTCIVHVSKRSNRAHRNAHVLTCIVYVLKRPNRARSERSCIEVYRNVSKKSNRY